QLDLARLRHAGVEPEQVGDRLVLARLAQLLDGYLERIVVGDPGRRLDHLRERPVGDALTVWQRTSGQHSRSFQPLDELAREPALADAGAAVDREQVRAAVSNGAFVGAPEEFELSLAPDERRGDAAPSRRPVDAGAAA